MKATNAGPSWLHRTWCQHASYSHEQLSLHNSTSCKQYYCTSLHTEWASFGQDFQAGCHSYKTDPYDPALHTHHYADQVWNVHGGQNVAQTAHTSCPASEACSYRFRARRTLGPLDTVGTYMQPCNCLPLPLPPCRRTNHPCVRMIQHTMIRWHVSTSSAITALHWGTDCRIV